MMGMRPHQICSRGEMRRLLDVSMCLETGAESDKERGDEVDEGASETATVVQGMSQRL